MAADEEFEETKVSFEDSEEVNAQACQLIEEAELPYVLLSKSTKMDDMSPWTMTLTLGNGIDDLLQAREMMIRCIDEIDIQLLRESE